MATNIERKVELLAAGLGALLVCGIAGEADWAGYRGATIGVWVPEHPERRVRCIMPGLFSCPKPDHGKIVSDRRSLTLVGTRVPLWDRVSPAVDSLAGQERVHFSGA